MRELFGNNETNDQGEVDITPMLDVVFIMLIFFIVTATFVKESGIEVSKSPTSPPITHETPTILITIDGNDQFFVNRRSVDDRALRPNIERLHAESPESLVVIQTHVDSTTKQLITAMDASRQAGVYHIAFADQLN